MSCLRVRGLEWTAVLYQFFGPDKPDAGHPGQPYIACHCQHVAHKPTWQRKEEGRGGVENLERRTYDPQGDAVVLLPCPSRLRIVVHRAVVDKLHHRHCRVAL